MRGAFLCFLGFSLLACGGEFSELPEHTYRATEIVDGTRVEVLVIAEITKDQCIALIKSYRAYAGPNGHVSVHKFNQGFGRTSPWCFENFDGKGVRFNDIGF
jgi:hypothetical protein